MIYKLRTIVAALFFFCLFSVWGAPRPVAVVTSDSASKLEELVCSIVLSPQWLADTAVSVKTIPWKKWKSQDYSSYSAVFFLMGSSSGSGLKLMNFSEADGSAAESFVQSGGHLFFLADASPRPGDTSDTGVLGKLLGMSRWVSVKGTVSVPEAAPAEARGLKSYPDIFGYTFDPALWGLQGRTTAEILVGSTEGALMTVNRLGKGKTVFASARFTNPGTPHIPRGQYTTPSLNQFFPIAKILYGQLDPKQTSYEKVKREIWGFEPLGPKVSGYGPYTRRKPMPVTPVFQKTADPSGRFILVQDGRPRAIFVVPDGLAGSNARSAADLLNQLLQKISGCVLPVRAEKSLKGQPPSAGRGYIAIGDTSFSRSLAFPEGGLAVKITPHLITVNGLNLRIAVMRFMHEYLGYQMIWPGPAGEVYQKSATVAVSAGSLIDAPHFPQRILRNYIYRNAQTVKLADGRQFKHHFGPRVLNGCRKLNFSPDKLPPLWKDHRAWWTANCLDSTVNMGGGGLFYNWNKHQGKGHPEYFALQIDGTRIPQVSALRLCKSNPGTVRAAADTVLEILKKRPSLQYFVFELCDTGYDYLCLCPNCRRMDPAVPDAYRLDQTIHRLRRTRPVIRYSPFSDRHLKFAIQVATLVGRKRPDIKFGYMAYGQYQTRPFLYKGKLPDNMFVIFVGLGYFDQEDLQKERETYDYWASVAKEICLRPNFLHGGHNMVNVYVSEMARDIRHAAENGMMGGDFDSVRHNWSTEGFNYYALARLMWNPNLTRDQLLAEYCDRPFGAAAPMVREYLKLVEENTRRIAAGKADNLDSVEHQRIDSADFVVMLHRYYSEPRLARWRELLDKAAAAVPADSMEHKRVEFLQAGLRFAELEARMRRLEAEAAPGKRKQLKDETRKYIGELTALFEAHPFAVNIPIVAHNEWWPFWYKNGWRPVKTSW